jgi:peptidoglycan/xylan/chitin deacetylase (PgdA/CDA1 family)
MPTDIPSPARNVTPTLTTRPFATETATCTLTIAPSPTMTIPPTNTPGPSPRVARSYPVDGDEDVGTNRPLIIEFDHPMDTRSVEANFRVSPTTASQVSWTNLRRLVCSPTHGWANGIEYDVALARGARDVHGAAMPDAFRLRFRRDGRGVPIPVLMYHHILRLDEEASKGQRTWTVSPEAFASQMVYLAEHDWQSITPTELAAYLKEGAPLPPRPIIISLDDGYKEVYTTALPVFMRTGLRPVLFIVPDYLGYGAYLNWSQLRKLVSVGFAVGSHGQDHSDLRGADDAELQRQVGDSRALLAEELDTSIDAFCYPFGSYDDRTLAALETHHYLTAFTLNPSFFQSAAEPYRLSRLRVTYDMSLEEFVELLP